MRGTGHPDGQYARFGSPHLRAAYGGIRARMSAIRTQLAVPEPDARMVGFREHCEIPNMLARGDVDGVIAMLHLHVGRNCQLLRQQKIEEAELKMAGE